MPEFVQEGDPAYSFGIAAAAGAAIETAVGIIPESISIERKGEFEAEAKQHEGMTAAHVTGIEMLEITISGFLVNKTVFDAATEFVYPVGGKTYTVNKRNRRLSNTDFVKAEIGGIHYQGAQGYPVA